MPNPTICIVDGCDKTAWARGWCPAHYARWRKRGTPGGGEIVSPGKTIEFIEAALAYQGADCVIWPYHRSRDGRARSGAGGKTQLVARHVCERVNGPPPTPAHEAAHECGKGHKGCISPHHLSWKTHTENVADMARHGTKLFGERCSWAKLSDEEVSEIRALRGIIPHQKIANRFGVARTTISGILRGESRAHQA